MPMLGLIAAALNCGDDAGLGAKTITLSFSQNNNYHYTYDPAAESPALDGYNGVTVDVEVDVDDRYDDGYSDGYNAGYTAGQSSVPIIPLNVTVNDTYTAQSGGYSPVVVNVPQSAAVTTQLTAEHNNTYTPPAGYDGYDEVIVNVPVTDFPEYNNLIACQQQIAAKLGLEPPYDCEDIEEAIDELDGYTFPSGTGYNPIAVLTNGDPITDENFGGYIEKVYTDKSQQQPPHSFNLVYRLVVGNTITNLYGGYFGGAEYISSSLTIDDSTTGTYTVTLTYYAYSYPVGERTKTNTYTSSALIGFGANGHTFSVKNKE